MRVLCCADSWGWPGLRQVAGRSGSAAQLVGGAIGKLRAAASRPAGSRRLPRRVEHARQGQPWCCACRWHPDAEPCRDVSGRSRCSMTRKPALLAAHGPPAEDDWQGLHLQPGPRQPAGCAGWAQPAARLQGQPRPAQRRAAGALQVLRWSLHRPHRRQAGVPRPGQQALPGMLGESCKAGVVAAERPPQACQHLTSSCTGTFTGAGADERAGTCSGVRRCRARAALGLHSKPSFGTAPELGCTVQDCSLARRRRTPGVHSAWQRACAFRGSLGAAGALCRARRSCCRANPAGRSQLSADGPLVLPSPARLTGSLPNQLQDVARAASCCLAQLHSIPLLTSTGHASHRDIHLRLAGRCAAPAALGWPGACSGCTAAIPLPGTPGFACCAWAPADRPAGAAATCTPCAQARPFGALAAAL